MTWGRRLGPCGRRLAWVVPSGTPPAGLRLVSVSSGTAQGSWARWPAQAAQAQLLKIRVKNLSSWLVPQEPVALATPSSRLPRLAVGPCASPPCWPLCQPSACPSGAGRAPGGPGGSSRAQWPECETCVGLCRWLSGGGCVTVCTIGLC